MFDKPVWTPEWNVTRNANQIWIYKNDSSDIWCDHDTYDCVEGNDNKNAKNYLEGIWVRQILYVGSHVSVLNFFIFF